MVEEIPLITIDLLLHGPAFGHKSHGVEWVGWSTRVHPPFDGDSGSVPFQIFDDAGLLHACVCSDPFDSRKSGIVLVAGERFAVVGGTQGLRVEAGAPPNATGGRGVGGHGHVVG